jgi:hypothetical protein
MQAVKGIIEKDIGHTLSDFHLFPWHLVKPEECGLSYGGITGDVDYNPHKPHIEFVYENHYAESWEIPEQLAGMLEQYWQWGRNEHARDIRSLLAEMD